MVLEIAWKNIWRSKLRSLVVIAAIGIGLLGGITAVAFMNGLLIGRIDDALEIETASLQLHNADFMENSELEFLIGNTDDIIRDIEKDSSVKAVSKRLIIETMISSNRSAAGVKLLGIEPEKEKLVSRLYQNLADSNSMYFEGVKRRPILIGYKLAQKLKVHVRSKLAVNVVDINGVSVRNVFRVVGIFKTQNTGFDEMNVFVRFSDMQKMLGIDDDKAHEIAVLLKEMLNSEQLKESMQREYTKYKIDEKALLKIRNDSIPLDIYSKISMYSGDIEYSKVLFETKLKEAISAEYYDQYSKQLYTACETGINISSWKQISPELAMQTTWMDFVVYVFVGIILAALGFGIINTMLMVVLERVREIGMLIAIGMNRRKVFSMIILESVMLSLVGGFIGILLGIITVTFLNSKGLDMSVFSEGMQALGYPSLVYPTIGFGSYVQITIMVIITGVLAAIYPALHAVRLNPSEAIKEE
ncbi:MAG: ABC transporter permease [Bacteroidales bacterium]|nr:ABC transporter permease [Bacteroidales bacterium]